MHDGLSYNGLGSLYIQYLANFPTFKSFSTQCLYLAKDYFLSNSYKL